MTHAEILAVFGEGGDAQFTYRVILTHKLILSVKNNDWAGPIPLPMAFLWEVM